MVFIMIRSGADKAVSFNLNLKTDVTAGHYRDTKSTEENHRDGKKKLIT
jgi:hypothetical protein